MWRTFISDSFVKLKCDEKQVYVKRFTEPLFSRAYLLPLTQRSTEAALGVRRSIRKMGKQTNKRAFWLGRREVSSQSSDWFDLIRKRIFFPRFFFQKRQNTGAPVKAILHAASAGKVLDQAISWTSLFAFLSQRVTARSVRMQIVQLMCIRHLFKLMNYGGGYTKGEGEIAW